MPTPRVRRLAPRAGQTRRQPRHRPGPSWGLPIDGRPVFLRRELSSGVRRRRRVGHRRVECCQALGLQAHDHGRRGCRQRRPRPDTGESWSRPTANKCDGRRRHRRTSRRDPSHGSSADVVRSGVRVERSLLRVPDRAATRQLLHVADLVRHGATAVVERARRFGPRTDACCPTAVRGSARPTRSSSFGYCEPSSRSALCSSASIHSACQTGS